MTEVRREMRRARARARAKVEKEKERAKERACAKDRLGFARLAMWGDWVLSGIASLWFYSICDFG